jgi:glycosyltransferase involved in cell wall biosynthesis
MTIGFYIHHTTISAGGIFTYTVGILKELLKAKEIEKVIIITSKKVNERLNANISDSKLQVVNINRNDLAVKVKLLIYFLLLTFSILLGKIIHAKKLIETLVHISNKINPYTKVLSELNISVFHIPVQYSPVYGIKVPIIITMHDLQEFHHPEFFSVREKIHRKINNLIAIIYSDHIIVSFKHVKDDILKFFKVSEDKVSICPPPFSESWFLSRNESSWVELSKKFELKKRYLLYPAATWKHKNHTTLIKALKKLRDEGIEIDLVCTGNRTEYHKTIQSLIDELDLSKVVHFLDIVTEEDLIGLYKNTRLVVIPTLYEAGSGPLYEAMRYGIPVVCSNVTSLPETVNNNEFVFDPNNLEEMTDKIKSGIVDEEFRKSNIQNSTERMKVLEKNNYSQSFINTYKKLLS